MTEPKIAVVGSAEIVSQPGAPLSGSYHATRLPGEKYPAWKLRMALEDAIRLVKRDQVKMMADMRKLEAAYGAWLDQVTSNQVPPSDQDHRRRQP